MVVKKGKIVLLPDVGVHGFIGYQITTVNIQ